MADSKVYLIVHGVVQGVGYRHLVRTMAIRHSIRGFVKNDEDGSVGIVAMGPADELEQFIRDIDVHFSAGPSVVHIERPSETPKGFPETDSIDKQSRFMIIE